MNSWRFLRRFRLLDVADGRATLLRVGVYLLLINLYAIWGTLLPFLKLSILALNNLCLFASYNLHF